ncbi:MAG TPA: response regulator [Geobacteraceae bacterium]
MKDKRRVMIVDDMPFMRNLLASILTIGDYDVVAEASDGAEAVRFFTEYRPDIILLDLDMPKVSGIEAMGQIRELDAEALVVLCGTSNNKGLPGHFTTAPDIDVITKPYVAEEVLRTIRKATCRHRITSEEQGNGRM